MDGVARTRSFCVRALHDSCSKHPTDGADGDTINSPAFYDTKRSSLIFIIGVRKSSQSSEKKSCQILDTVAMVAKVANWIRLRNEQSWGLDHHPWETELVAANLCWKSAESSGELHRSEERV